MRNQSNTLNLLIEKNFKKLTQEEKDLNIRAKAFWIPMKFCHIEEFYRPMPNKLSYDHVCKGSALKKKPHNHIKFTPSYYMKINIFRYHRYCYGLVSFPHRGLTRKEGRMVKYKTFSLASPFTFWYRTTAESNELAHLRKPFCMLLPSPLTLILADLPLGVCQFYWYNMCPFISCVLISTERYLKLIQVKNYFITSEEN